jgi:transcriptional regulator with XRE-family HTH domain
MTPVYVLLSSMVARFFGAMLVGPSYVSELERGERNPTIITLSHTAKALGVRLQELTTERGVRR